MGNVHSQTFKSFSHQSLDKKSKLFIQKYYNCLLVTLGNRGD